ncbi:MAG: vanadium-dependent haloperoxidase [Verrucomicrobia bacterium]|nr:vanadium-dependent haloperoxidase [Verrucomicrobiota bacterium]
MTLRVTITTAITVCGLAGTALAQTKPGTGFQDLNQVWGRHYQSNADQHQWPGWLSQQASAAERLRHWNKVAIDASGLDHTPPPPGDHRIWGEQLGPTRASRAMAIVHIAMFDSVNAVAHRYQTYTGVQGQNGASMSAAIAESAAETLTALFPAQTTSFNNYLADDLSQLSPSAQKQAGIQLGHEAAAAILRMRENDGSARPEPRVGVEFVCSKEPGKWRQDPISHHPLAFGAYWGEVKPFVMRSSAQFRPPAPPALTSAEYTAAYNNVKALGGDGTVTPTTRTPEQTIIGTYWAYDGTPSLCAPPRLYNELIVHIADQLGTSKDPVEFSRLLALANVAMADVAISVWEAKYFYQFWRPITGIRESDPGTGQTGRGDGNPSTIGDPKYTPLGAPASNLTGPNFTPPFPSYPSGHGGFGGALFEVLRRFYGTDHIAFSFISDEFNGKTRNDNGSVRPVVSRSFSSLSQAEEENGQSRIYLGIHWTFDKTAALSEGERVADFVFAHAFGPAERR